MPNSHDEKTFSCFCCPLSESWVLSESDWRLEHINFSIFQRIACRTIVMPLLLIVLGSDWYETHTHICWADIWHWQHFSESFIFPCLIAHRHYRFISSIPLIYLYILSMLLLLVLVCHLDICTIMHRLVCSLLNAIDWMFFSWKVTHTLDKC